MTKAAKQDPEATMERLREITRSCPVKLTDEEKIEHGERLAKHLQDLERAESRKAEVTASLKADIEAHKALAKTVGTVLSNGYEYRDVKCAEYLDYNRQIVRIVRTDTGAEVGTRQVEERDRQASLDFEPEDEEAAT